MKLITPTALGLMLAGVAAPASAQYGQSRPTQTVPAPQGETEAPAEAKGSIRPSAKAVKALQDLQKAVQANDRANIPAKLAAAQAVATTREDRFIIAQLQLKAAASVNDLASASAAADAMAASGLIDSAQIGRLYRGIGGSYYNAKQYAQAAAAYERAIALNPRDVDALTMLAESRNGEGRKADAASVFQRTIQASLAAGQKPKEEVYRRAVSLAYDAKAPSAPELARQWVAAYPSADSWRNAIGIYRNINRPDPESVLDLMRLLRLTGAMTPTDFGAYLYALNAQSNFIEAQNALANPGQVNVSSPEVTEVARTVKGKPKVTAADLSAAAKSAASATALLRIGDRYYGLGDYAKAAETYRQAKAKGADANLINERVGVALAVAGDKAGAAAALKSVTGARAGVAQFWLLYLQQG
ncbi:MAG: tetratricopeptide repeat protein [Sphingomicrobium sp.]